MKNDSIQNNRSRTIISKSKFPTVMDAKPDSEQFLPIIELIQNIIKGENASLHSLHNRKFLPGIKKNEHVTITEFINSLAETSMDNCVYTGELPENIEYAQNLTNDKFSRIPSLYLKRPSVDCRNYFRAFIKRMTQFKTDNPHITQLTLEAAAVKEMKGLIIRHYSLSLQEARRRNNKSFSRYCWKVKGKKINIKMPIALAGRKRSEWLNKHIDELNPHKPEARKRIQSIIYQYFGKELFVSYVDGLKNEQEEKPVHDTDDSPALDLGKTVALEKIKLIKQQRPAIRKLGPLRLKLLIERIFSDLEDCCFKDGTVADDFGISKSTFSRFAGSDWLKSKSGVPDLWRNTAEVVMAYPVFRNAVNTDGIKEILQNRI
jgi:hypothetical protein